MVPTRILFRPWHVTGLRRMSELHMPRAVSETRRDLLSRSLSVPGLQNSVLLISHV